MGWEVWVFPVNNTDRDKDHTGHTSRDVVDAGVRTQTARTVHWHAKQIPEGGASPACKRGPKGEQNHRYEGAKQFEKRRKKQHKTSGVHSKDSSTVGTTLKINIFICSFERSSLQHEVEKEGRMRLQYGSGCGTMRRADNHWYLCSHLHQAVLS